MSKTYNDLYLKARRAFREAGIKAFDLEARLILSYATGKPSEKLMRDMLLYTSAEIAEKIESLITRRLNGEPVAYITGSWEFYGIPLEITPAVMIPRVDTELLAKAAIELMRNYSGARILDLCSGSGCLGCAIAHEIPGARVVMADSNRDALKICRRNVLQNDLNTSVSCVEADAMADPPMSIGSFDLIVSNPPYIPTADIPTLDVSVRDFEPSTALDGGADGLDFYKSILARWKVIIRDGGHIMFEIGEKQAEEVRKLMRLSGVKNIMSAIDTLGIERVVWGKV
ncbi:MAG: peptide chain release factor N(5)-glutamine methyltransferase [Oscillospiraceae bacterium]|nr:peptide chain release factor N(5)-glutamine methyltransferase [Oscillospiraceae bacterium]